MQSWLKLEDFFTVIFASGTPLSADLVSFIESGKTVWVGGIAVLLSASWLIYDLSENGWADRPVLETVLRYSELRIVPRA